MKLLFVLRHAMYLRNFESTIRVLLERGHQVEVGCVGPDGRTPPVLARLSAHYPGCTYRPLPGREDIWKPLLLLLRHGIDYLRYLDPQYARAPKLAARARGNLPAGFRALLGALAAMHPRGWRGAVAVLRGMERLIPPDPAILRILETSGADVLAVSPLVDPSSDEVEYLKAAEGLGIRTVYCVASWDNLTNKGLVQADVDRVTVWNRFMQREAVEMHDISADRIVVTGAPLFDQWFSLGPARSRDAFLAEVRLPAKPATILYLCSSGFIAADEVEFVRRWLSAVRTAGSARLRDAAILIRPHPANTAQWQQASFADEAVAVWPREGAHPLDEQTRADYFDSMYYSDLVVGLNTSGLIEAGIVGRPVFTVLDPAFANTQGGTLHFHYLVEHGLLSVAPELGQHLVQMSEALEAGDPARAARSRFLETFVRPEGLSQPCSPLLATAIETAAALPHRIGVAPSAPRRALRLALAPVAWACSAAYFLREAGRTAR